MSSFGSVFDVFSKFPDGTERVSRKKSLACATCALRIWPLDRWIFTFFVMRSSRRLWYVLVHTVLQCFPVSYMFSFCSLCRQKTAKFQSTEYQVSRRIVFLRKPLSSSLKHFQRNKMINKYFVSLRAKVEIHQENKKAYISHWKGCISRFLSARESAN